MRVRDGCQRARKVCSELQVIGFLLYMLRMRAVVAGALAAVEGTVTPRLRLSR